MPVAFRPDDPIRDNDDVVLRAGGGAVQNLVQRAIENADEYHDLVAQGICPSPFTISVHVPRRGRASKDDLLANPPYVRYRPYLEAAARVLLSVEFVTVVATTVLEPSGEPTLLDLCHYDVVVDAADQDQLTERIGVVRNCFVRHDNPAHHL